MILETVWTPYPLGVGVDLLVPQAVAAAGDGSVFVAETNQHRIVRVTLRAATWVRSTTVKTK